MYSIKNKYKLAGNPGIHFLRFASPKGELTPSGHSKSLLFFITNASFYSSSSITRRGFDVVCFTDDCLDLPGICFGLF